MAFERSNGKIISNIPCPHCNKQTTYEEIISEFDCINAKTLVYDDKKFPFPYKIHFSIFQCEHCNKYRFIIERVKDYRYNEEKETILEFPFPGFSDIDRGKIKHQIILENLDEGMRCLAANSPKGAIVNFRRALQAAALLLGGKGDTLEKQIDDLHEKEIIRSKTREIAHKIRAFGNLGAHPFEIKLGKEGEITPDFFSELIIDDAISAVGMLVLFLEDAFVYPSKLNSIDQRLDEFKNNL